MLIDEYDFGVLKRAEEMMITNYNIMELLNKEYFIKKDDLIALIEDLLMRCEHLEQEVDSE